MHLLQFNSAYYNLFFLHHRHHVAGCNECCRRQAFCEAVASVRQRRTIVDDELVRLYELMHNTDGATVRTLQQNQLFAVALSNGSYRLGVIHLRHQVHWSASAI